MSVAATFARLQAHRYAALPLNALKRVRHCVAGALSRIPRWKECSRSEAAAIPSQSECPSALPGLNQRLVRNSWLQSGNKILCTDGRLRLSSRETLDICATPRQAARAIRHFARWLDYLAVDGIGVEVRKLDGWRTCALVDGVAVPIRVRERMCLVPRGNWLNIAIERWLGGSIPTMLVSSGRLELQLLRMGVAFASFPVEGEVSHSTMEKVSRAIRDMAKRQVGYQQRMHAVAVSEAAKRETSAKPRKRRAAAPVPEPKPAAAQLAPQENYADVLAGLAALSALGSAQIQELVQAIGKLTENTRASELQAEREASESVARLAQAIAGALRLPADEREPAVLTVISGSEAKEGKSGSTARVRRSRRVA
ncbi:MAG: hypothetical protein IT169_15755 [Bryobacterales bacterium]|nr:hypothetical protein [Bryobacterales bacterium]